MMNNMEGITMQYDYSGMYFIHLIIEIALYIIEEKIIKMITLRTYRAYYYSIYFPHLRKRLGYEVKNEVKNKIRSCEAAGIGY